MVKASVSRRLSFLTVAMLSQVGARDGLDLYKSKKVSNKNHR